MAETMGTVTEAPTGLLSGYDTGGFYDEAVDETDELRPEYEVLFDRLRTMTHEELARRAAMSDDTMRKRGVTFTLSADAEAEAEGDEDLERTLPMDVLPRVIGGAAWRDLEAGLIQRVSALNAFLEDLYVGERAAVRDGIVPWWLVTSSDGFVREAMGVPAPSGVRCLVAGLDLVRGADGRLRVLEDNLRNPSGISYVLENRDLMTRLFPSIVRAHRVRPVGNYGERLLRALRSVAPSGVADPCVVVMTPGIHNAAYFEHAFLAHQMGVELVEGHDLLVDGQRVFMRTTEGPRPVHVIYRRLDDRFLDPVGFRSGSYIGVPGLLSAARAGAVTMANAVGNGVADDKAVYPFVPDLVRYYLNEEPLLPNVGTYCLWDPDQRAAVLDRLDELVTKPVDGAGGYGLVIGPTASDEQLAVLRAQIDADPRGYISQEVVQLSRVPTVAEDGLAGRHVDLRPFIISSADGIEVVPGGLTRVALEPGSLVVNSSQGGGSKDTWVLR
ncbi:MAG: circularly permuted type 2 ATP-grasp protein [Acidimicrobiales bacterium]